MAAMHRTIKHLLRAASLLVTFAILGLALMLAACAGRTPAPTPGPAVPTPTLAPLDLPTPTGPLTLTFWEDDGDAAGVLLDELTAAFMRANPGITITRTHFSYDDLRNQVRNEARAGRGPDLVRARGEFAGPFSELGIVRPVEELYETAFLDQYLPGALAGVTVRGRPWALPENYGSHLLLLQNRGYISNTLYVTATAPVDTDSWLVQLGQLTNPVSATYGLVYPLTESYWLIPWLGGHGGWPLDAADRPALDTAEMVAALTFVRDFKTAGVVPQQADYDRAFNLFSQGRAAYIIDGAWNLSRYQGLGLDVAVVLLPRVSSTQLLPIPMATGRYWFISTNTQGARLEAAVRFAEWMTSDEAQEQWLLKLGRLPSHALTAQHPTITGDPQQAAIMAQLRLARGVPAALEMSCAWQGIDSQFAAVMAGEVTPEDGAAAMQTVAEACIADMTPDPTPVP